MYQFNLTKQALIQNTLVCVPTGLGKTFVALNVMYNYWRWFPDGQIIFMAPTKPLVAQQKNALASSQMFVPDDTGKGSQMHQKFSKIFGRPNDASRDLIVLDGNTPAQERVEAYRTHRVIFCTPQIIDNDLDSKRFDPRRVCLLVIDEAHRAHGDYSYCTVVKKLTLQNRGFRILALSATPGPKMEAIQEVISNLNISTIEILTDSDPEIRGYIQPKKVTPIEVNIDEGLDFLRVPISACVEMCFQNLKRLLGGNPRIEYFNRAATFKSVGGVRFLQQEFQKANQRQKNLRKNELSEVWVTFGCAYALVSAKKALTEQGVEPFKVKAAEGLRKIGALDQNSDFIQKLRKSSRFQELVREAAGLDDLVDKNHPKVDKLVEIITEFCENRTLQDNNSKCMVFSNTRINVGVLCGRLQKIPGAKPTVFLGQSSGQRVTGKARTPSKNRQSKGKEGLGNADLLKIFSSKKDPTPMPIKERQEEQGPEEQGAQGVSEQTETDRLLEWEDKLLRPGGMRQGVQKQTLEDFKTGKYNVLIATCVGEEGLDIGEVDLTICYDEGLDPIRMWQRMGRTGRKRPGQIILLMSQDEMRRYQKALKDTQNVVAKLRNEMASKKRTGTCELRFYKRSPRMVPEELGDFSLELVCPKVEVEEVCYEAEAGAVLDEAEENFAGAGFSEDLEELVGELNDDEGRAVVNAAPKPRGRRRRRSSEGGTKNDHLEGEAAVVDRGKKTVGGVPSRSRGRPKKRTAPLVDIKGQEKLDKEIQEQHQRDLLLKEASERRSRPPESCDRPSDGSIFACRSPFPIPSSQEPKEPTAPKSPRNELQNDPQNRDP